jgi:hypothetical protein
MHSKCIYRLTRKVSVGLGVGDEAEGLLGFLVVDFAGVAGEQVHAGVAVVVDDVVHVWLDWIAQQGD